jgi:DNA-binding response OmpR family regulator
MHIIIIEDDPHIATLIAIHLQELPAEVEIFHEGWAGLDAALTGSADLLVLDLMLPGVNGLEICRRVRQKNQYLPILMLTSKSEEADKITGLEMGADDYLTKPFSTGELVARVKAILRRTQHEKMTLEKKQVRFAIGELVLDLKEKTAFKNGDELILTAKEFELLHLFMQHPGRSFSRQQILDLVWGEQFEGLEHTVNSNINRLRAKIEADLTRPRYILTAWGVGYKFNNEL